MTDPKQIPWDERERIDDSMIRNYEARVKRRRIYCGLRGGRNNDLIFASENAMTYLSETLSLPLKLMKSGKFELRQPYSHYFSEKCAIPYTQSLEKRSTRVLVHPDYSTGLEENPIRVFDDTESLDIVHPEPKGFCYITKNIIPTDLKELSPVNFPAETYITSCNCKGKCNSDCLCVKLGQEISLRECAIIPDKGCIFTRGIHTNYATVSIFCGEHCGCPPECSNRLSNLINPQEFEVYKDDEEVGYCVRTLTNIQYGEVVCEFVGEVATNLCNEDYAFSLSSENDTHFRDVLCSLSEPHIPEDAWNALRFDNAFIDPYKYGNIARLLKHSCLPNLVPIRAIANDWRPYMHHVLLVAIAPIPAGTELTFNYGISYYNRLGSKCKCNSICCGSTKKIWSSKIPYDQHSAVVYSYMKHLYSMLDAVEQRRQKKMGVEDDDDCLVVGVVQRDPFQQMLDSIKWSRSPPAKRRCVKD